MGPELRSLVEAKASMVAAQSNLDSAQRDPMASNPAIARNNLQTAENKFTDTFDGLNANGGAGMTNAVNDLNSRNQPPAPPVAQEPAIASMGTYQGNGNRAGRMRAVQAQANQTPLDAQAYAQQPAQQQPQRRTAMSISPGGPG